MKQHQFYARLSNAVADALRSLNDEEAARLGVVLSQETGREAVATALADVFSHAEQCVRSAGRRRAARLVAAPVRLALAPAQDPHSPAQ